MGFYVGKWLIKGAMLASRWLKCLSGFLPIGTSLAMQRFENIEYYPMRPRVFIAVLGGSFEY